MTRQRIYLILLLLLILVAAYFYFSDKGSTLKKEYSDFAIEDTASINRIFIADYEGKTADLTRQRDGSWKINDTYTVRPDAIELLLHTFHDIDVREPVSKSTFNTVVKELAVKSTKVEIYMSGTKPAKVYYVGHATKTHYGTNMLLEIDEQKSSVPYVMHIPGFFGYLSTRFFTNEDLWRDRTIFAAEPEEVASISIRYLEKPFQSFEMKRNDAGEFEVIDLQKHQKLEKIQDEILNEYVSRYRGVHFELIDNESDQHTIDSVLSTPPLHTIELTKKNGEKTVLKTFYKPITDGTIDPVTNEPYEYNIDRLFGYINETDFVIMQWPTLDNILAYYDDFKKPENVNN